MSLSFKPALIAIFAISANVGFAGAAGAASVYGVLPFQNTGANPPSQYGDGSQPESELLQASDGNYYGTTTYGGSGLCQSGAPGNPVLGCGTIFRISAATGAETVLYSFPYEVANRSAPNGAYPTAGLIQGKDGALYGVTSDGGGGTPGPAEQFGCGTLFRISMTGGFTLLHQFHTSDYLEGSQPESHLVQTTDGTLYGVTSYDGFNLAGTLFSATTSGVVTTLHYFDKTAGDGVTPAGALLIGHDGSTLYGTTEFGGDDDGGTVFSYSAGTLTILHSFDKIISNFPLGALIYGADGLLYGTTTYLVHATGSSTTATVYSLNTDGGGFAVDATFRGGEPYAGLLLGSDGMMYGTLYRYSTVLPYGGLFVYNPAIKTIQLLVDFGNNTGGGPLGSLIEGKDNYLYGSNAQYGPSNSFGVAKGTLFRIGPPLP